MRYVIVGGGLAAARAAEAVRKSGFDGEVMLIGAERELPYDRPPLSKEYLAGVGERDALFIHPPSFYSDARIAVELGQKAVSLDCTGRSVTLESGRDCSFDKLLIATGSEPFRLDVPGADLEGVYSLRTLNDSEALGAALRKASSVVVIGAGLIGLEVAAIARMAGKQVTVIESTATPLKRLLGPRWGKVVAELHRDKGVDVRLSSEVAALRGSGSGRVEEVVLKNEAVISSDVVVVSIGVRPTVSWLAGSGLEVGDGVLVNEFCQTSVPGIYAAGDVTSAWSVSLNRRMRVEHYGHASSQGATAGRAMAGERVAFDPVPVAGSEQFGVRLQVVGHVQENLITAVRGNVSARSFTSFFLDERSQVRAAVSIGRPKDMLAARRLITTGVVVSAAQLTDESFDLGTLRLSSHQG